MLTGGGGGGVSLIFPICALLSSYPGWFPFYQKAFTLPLALYHLWDEYSEIIYYLFWKRLHLRECQTTETESKHCQWSELCTFGIVAVGIFVGRCICCRSNLVLEDSWLGNIIFGITYLGGSVWTPQADSGGKILLYGCMDARVYGKHMWMLLVENWCGSVQMLNASGSFRGW